MASRATKRHTGSRLVLAQLPEAAKLGDLLLQVGDQPATLPEQVTAELAYSKPDSDDLIAVLVHKKTGDQWLGLWVGRPNSGEFVNRGFAPEPSVGTQDAAAHK
jgi:hypothetical protein